MTTAQENFMNTAIRLAETNMENGHGDPFGCVIVKNFDDKQIYQELCLPLPDRIIPFQQIMQQKVWDIFKTWTRKNLNIKY